MKTKFLIIGLAVLTLASGFAVRATRQAGQNRAAIDAFAAQSARLRDATARLEQRLRTASQLRAQEQQAAGQQSDSLGASESADAAGSGIDEAAPGKDAGAKPSGRVTATTIIANDPQKLAEYLQSYRTNLDNYYGSFKALMALGFSPEQVEKFKDLRIEYQQRFMDLEAAAAMHGLDSNSDTYKKLRAEISSANAKKETELLGKLRTPLYEYHRTQPVRYFARELAGSAVYSGAPVTYAQVERTTQILAANSQRTQMAQTRGSVDQNTLNWAAARAQLQDVLSPSQIEILGSIIQRDATQAKVDELQKRLTAEFKGQPLSK